MMDPNEHKMLPETKNWFDNQMQIIAIMHDLAGPDISLIELKRYRNEVAAEISRRALAAHATGKLIVELTDLNVVCQLAAEELIRIRQMRKARVQGKLSTQTMKELPLYKAFRAYLDEDPELVQKGLASVLADQEVRNAISSSPPSDVHATLKSSGPVTSFSAKTELWLESQVLAFAIADDLSDRPCDNVDTETYVGQSAPCFRNNILRAVQIGNLTVEMDQVDDLCLHAAAKAFELRRLKVAYSKGQVSKKKLNQLPKHHREYLEQMDVMKSLMQHAAVLHKQILQKRSAKTN